MNKLLVYGSVTLSIIFIVIAMSVGGDKDNSASADVITDDNGTQVIHILARGGFTPRNIVAASGKPTRLEVTTKGTYDCSAYFVIPKLGYKKQLPPTGVTNIDVPAQSAGSEITGLCGMGMYYVKIAFE